MPTGNDPYEGLDANFAMQLHQLVSAVNAQGGHLTYSSGKRDTAQQQALYDAAVKKYGQANAANWAAVPGTSNHERGMAMDLGGDAKSLQLAHKLAGQFGLNFPLANEGWHIEPAGMNRHNNNGGPPYGSPQTNGTSAPVGTDNTPENRIGAVINFLTGGQSSTGGQADGFLPNSDPTMSAVNSPSLTKTATGGSGVGGDVAKIAGSSAYDAQFSAAAAKYGISAALLKAVAKQESGFNPNAQSGVGAKGLMQFMPDTAKGLGINPLDPNQAIDGAARLLSQYIGKYGSVDKALAAYNAGPGAVDKYNGVPPYAETQHYVKNIMSMVGGN